MKRLQTCSRWLPLWLCAIAVAIIFWRDVLRADQQTRLTDEKQEKVPRIQPKSPTEGLKTFSLPQGFRMELLAHEPLVTDPVAMVYDEKGAMYVAELSSYPHPENAGQTAFGRIRVLLDQDRDGLFESSHVFVERLPNPTSVICWKGGVFVTAAPEIWYFKDTNGDHKADVRRKVYTGFGRNNAEQLVNNLKWGIDHRIYGAASHSGGQVRPVETPGAKPVSLRGRDFRFSPATDRFEAISRGDSRWGNSFDDWYNRFVCQNTGPARHVVLPLRYLARNPYLRVSQVYKSLAKEGGTEPVYRTSPPEPWRVVRARRRRARGKNANPGEINATGFFTSSCGITVYRGTAYPPEFRGNLFIGEAAGNLVHRRVVAPDGVSFQSRRAVPKREVIASSDNFFRAVNFVNAPDGTLHVVDMYREVVEGPSWVPEDLKRTGQVDIAGGSDRGRIYRLTPPNFKPPPPPRLGGASTNQLVAQLENANSWWRETAHRLLYEGQDKSAVAPLRELLKSSSSPLARLHALWSLNGLSALRDDDVLAALDDQSAGVREHAVRLAERRFSDSSRLFAKVLALASDRNARVRFQVALTLGQTDNARAVDGLARIAHSDAADLWIRTAVLSSAYRVGVRLFERLLQSPDFLKRESSLVILKEQAFVAGAKNKSDEVDRVLAAISNGDPSDEKHRQLTLLVALSEGLRQSRSDLFERRLAEGDSRTGRMLRRMLNRALRLARDAQASEELRREAITLLGYESFDRIKGPLAELLGPKQPHEVQRAAVRSLARYPRLEVAQMLLAKLSNSPPAVRLEMTETLLARADWTVQFLNAVKSKQITASDISLTRRSLLLKHDDPKVRKRAKSLFGGDRVSPRKDVIVRYKSALKLSGDPDRGRVVFERDCLACHRFGDKGNDIGPNLSAYGRKRLTAEALMTQILDPNREVAPNYFEYIAVLDSGRTVTGFIASQTAGSITFKREKNQQTTVFRKNIEQLKSTGKSLMPEGIEKKIDVKQMADLLAFLLTINERI